MLSPGSRCYAGGGLALYGTLGTFHAECTCPNGTVFDAPVKFNGMPTMEDSGIV